MYFDGEIMTECKINEHDWKCKQFTVNRGEGDFSISKCRKCGIKAIMGTTKTVPKEASMQYRNL